MLKSLIINIGSGYALKMVQICCGLITVPILISDKGLGLAGYGQLAVALSLSALMSMLFDGFRLIASKTIGSNKDTIYEETITILQCVVIIILPVACVVSLFAEQLLEFLGLRDQSTLLVYLISIYFLFDQLLYITEQYYHSNIKTFVINFANGVEGVIRLLFIVLVFRNHTGTLSHYFQIFIVTYCIKFIVYQVLINRSNKHKKIPYLKVARFQTFVRESIPLSFRGISIFLVFRMSIIYANKYLSSEAAAVFSIIFVTLRGYLSQIFVSVMHPMVIPVVSRISFTRISYDNLQKYRNIISVFEFMVLSIVSFTACFTPFWLTLWLGDTFLQYLSLISLAVGMLGIEVAFSLKSLVLVSQNLGGVLAKYSFVACIGYLITLLSFEYLGLVDLRSLTFLVVGYVYIYNYISVNHVFSRAFKSDWRANTMVLVTIISLIMSYIFIRSTNNDLNLFIITSVIYFLLLTCLLVTSWLPIKHTLKNYGKISP